MNVLIKLIFAHLLADFSLQSTTLCENKKKLGIKGMKYQILHALIHASTTYLILMDWEQWIIPLLIFISHFIIDLIKIKFKISFVLDQIFHFAIIFILYFWQYSNIENIFEIFQKLHNHTNLWIIILSYLIVLKPTSVIIGLLIEKWLSNQKESVPDNGLPKAGHYIGYLERLLIVTFIHMGYYESIGFLLAAKSIFRFGELKEKEELRSTEYVLIGTLLSFIIAIAVGIISNAIIQ